MKGYKLDEGKDLISLVPASTFKAVAKTMAYGMGKYPPHNWRQGMEWSRVINATFRHLLAFNEGEDIDPESKLPHLFHAMTNLSFLVEYYTQNLGTDDRYKQETV